MKLKKDKYYKDIDGVFMIHVLTDPIKTTRWGDANIVEFVGQGKNMTLPVSTRKPLNGEIEISSHTEWMENFEK